MSVQNLMQELAIPAGPVSAAKLAELSGLSGAPLRAFAEAWPEVPAAKRMEVVNKLSDLAEDNVELDFSQVFRVLLEDEDAQIRVRAIAGLWECQERSLIEPLMGLLLNDPEESVRSASAQALGRFALLAETGRLLKRDADRLANVLFDVIDNDEETVEVRRRALESIAQMGLPRVPEVIQDAYDSEIPSMRASAVYAMGVTSSDEWIPHLLEELNSDDPEMRYEAVVALGEIGSEEALRDVAALISDPDVMVQTAAITSVASIGGEPAKRILSTVRQSPDEHIAELADLALRSMEFEEEPEHFHGFGGRPKYEG